MLVLKFLVCIEVRNKTLDKRKNGLRRNPVLTRIGTSLKHIKLKSDEKRGSYAKTGKMIEV